MQDVSEVLPSGSFDPHSASDRVVLDHDMRLRRRIVLRTVGGASVRLYEARPVQLRDGDGLRLANGDIMLVEAAGEALIRPETFHAAANYYGYSPDRPIPGRVAIAGALRPAGDGRVCAAKRDGPCMLTFTREGSTWRLSGFDPQAANLHLRR